MNATVKLATYGGDGSDISREDVNQCISALVRMGYEVWMVDEYICFKVGNDDIINTEQDDSQKNISN